jgi:hypothetical protein
VRNALVLVAAVAGGLVLGWWITLIGAEVIRSLFGSYFDGVDWPAWFPTTPIVLVTLVLWAVIARATWRRFSRPRDRAA